MNKDVYTIITNRFIELIEKSGTLPWNKPWRYTNPQNFISKKEYRGINRLMLMFSEFSSPYWITLNQVKTLKGRVKDNEFKNSFLITFYTKIDKTDETNDDNKQTNQYYILRYYYLYNIEQTDLPAPQMDLPVPKTNDQIERFIESIPNKPTIIFRDNDIAGYAVKQDIINLPNKDTFLSSENYYATLFHELGHATRHESRLNRKKDNKAYEELIAELTSAFLMSHFGIQHIDTEKNNASYLQGWLTELQNDKKLLIQASNAAQKACDYLLGITVNKPAHVEELVPF
jgi:antirestriction protein ArdC